MQVGLLRDLMENSSLQKKKKERARERSHYRIKIHITFDEKGQ